MVRLEEYASKFDPRAATCRAAISGAPETIVRRELDLTIVLSPDHDASEPNRQSHFCRLLRSRSSPIPDFERAAGKCSSTYRDVGRCGSRALQNWRRTRRDAG